MVLNAIRQKAVRFGIGLTAGASARGIDGVAARFKGSGPDFHVKVLRSAHFPYPQGLRDRLLAARYQPRELGLLHFELGELLAEAALELKKATAEEATEMDFAAFQGFPFAHLPPRAGSATCGELELGEAAIVAERTRLPVVSNFSARDMAAGGQGRPVHAYGSWLLFSREDRTAAHLHLGAFAAMTVVPSAVKDVVGFEVGPCCLAIDGAFRLLTSGNREIDTDGATAGGGVVIDEFLEYLLDQPYFNRVPPKSTSRDEFGAEVYLRDALAGRRDRPLQDLIATVTSAVAFSIIRAYTRFIKPTFQVARLIVSGGGANNKTLVKHIRQGMSEVVLRRADEYGLPCSELDALLIAILGNETLCDNASNLPQVSGARRALILGQITPP